MGVEIADDIARVVNQDIMVLDQSAKNMSNDCLSRPLFTPEHQGDPAVRRRVLDEVCHPSENLGVYPLIAAGDVGPDMIEKDITGSLGAGFDRETPPEVVVAVVAAPRR